MKSGKRKTNKLGTPTPKEEYNGEFPAFSFSIIYPKLGVKETRKANKYEKKKKKEKK